MPIDPNTVVSVVAALEDDADYVEAFLSECDRVLREHYRFFEILLVDDGSEDATAEKVAALLAKIGNVRCMRLSRHFGRDVALSAGLESAIGDFVVTLDPRCDPPSRIPDLVTACRQSGGVVHGVATGVPGRGFLRESLGGGFRKYCKKHLGVTIDRGMGEFRAMSRQAVNALLQVQVQNRYLRVLTSSLGFGQGRLDYELVPGAMPRRQPLFSEISTAIDLIAANTRHPLRVLTWVGLIAALLNVAYAGYVVAVYLSKPGVAQGWTTSSLQQSGMFFFAFLILTVLSEYVGTLIAEVRTRPLYFLAGEKTSTVLLEDSVQSSIVEQSTDHGLVNPDN